MDISIYKDWAWFTHLLEFKLLYSYTSLPYSHPETRAGIGSLAAPGKEVEIFLFMDYQVVLNFLYSFLNHSDIHQILPSSQHLLLVDLAFIHRDRRLTVEPSVASLTTATTCRSETRPSCYAFHAVPGKPVLSASRVDKSQLMGSKAVDLG